MHNITDSPKSQQDGAQKDDAADTSILSIQSQAQGYTVNEAHDGSLLQDPFIHTPSLQTHNEEEREVISALVVIPDRDLRQLRSSGGKLAYVIFGDQTTGVYYNWSSCSHKLNSYTHSGSRKPRFYGYATYEEADVAWEFFLENHIVPFPPTDGGVSATVIPPAQPMSPQRNRSILYTSGLSPIPASPSRQTLVSPPATPAAPPLYSPTAPLSQTHTTEAMFFVVIVGYNPGVFGSRRLAAINSRSDGPILEAASRHEANQLFVDAFMTDRVQRL